MSQILEKLYLGGYGEARSLSKLRKWGVTHVVAVAAEAGPCFPGSFSYIHVKAYDFAEFNLALYFDQVADFINNAIEVENGIVFVHCQMGISRSSTCVIAYLMKYNGMDFYRAKQFVATKRSVICPNPGFQRQLIMYEKLLRPPKSEKNLADTVLPTATTKVTKSQIETKNSNVNDKLEEEKQLLNKIPLKTLKPAKSVDKTVYQKSTIKLIPKKLDANFMNKPMLLQGIGLKRNME